MSHPTITLDAPDLPSGDRLWHAARLGRLGPMLHAGRAAIAGAAPPEPWRRRFRSDYFASVVSHHVYLVATREILTEAAEARIPAMVLRGGAVAERHYAEDPALRPYTDIDLLVPRGCLAEAKALAGRLGYRAAPGSFPAAFYERHHLHLRYIAPATGVPLEVHWALDHPLSLQRIDYADLFRSAHADRLGGAPVLRPSPVDEFALLAIHLAKHANSLRALPAAMLPSRALDKGLVVWMADLDRIVRRDPGGFDWDGLTRRARSWEAAVPIGEALRATSAVLGTPVPEEVLRDLRGRWSGGLLERGLARVASGRGALSRRFRALSGRVSASPAVFSLDRLAEVERILLPPGEWVRRHAPAPWLPLPFRRALHAMATSARAGRMLLDLAARVVAGPEAEATHPYPIGENPATTG
jgi:hypothetical protein